MWDCISLRAALYDSTIFQGHIERSKSSTEGSEGGRPDGLSCIDREQGDPRSTVAYSPPFSPGGIAFQTFGNAVPRTKTGNGAQRRLLSSISLLSLFQLPLSNLPNLRRHSACAPTRLEN
jgi:hypothetical protein